MTNFERIAENPETLGKFLDKYAMVDDNPWINWFNANHCDKCEPIKTYNETWGHDIDIAFCETTGYCKFFPQLKEIPDNYEVLKMWLNLSTTGETETQSI